MQTSTNAKSACKTKTVHLHYESQGGGETNSPHMHWIMEEEIQGKHYIGYLYIKTRGLRRKATDGQFSGLRAVGTGCTSEYIIYSVGHYPNTALFNNPPKNSLAGEWPKLFRENNVEITRFVWWWCPPVFGKFSQRAAQ